METKIKNTVSTNWKNIPDKRSIYTADDIIEAWENGKAYYNDYMRNMFMENVSKIKSKSENLFNDINRDKNRSRTLLLKINSINSFSIIYMLDREIYSSDDKVKNIYQKSWDMEKEFDKEKIMLDISFMPYSENININRLNADGYTSFYGKL
jgi:hypothetical protein